MPRLDRAGLAGILALMTAVLANAPAQAQMDFSGEWNVVPSQDNSYDPHVGEFAGLPLSPEAIRRAEIWDASIQSLPEWQCRPHSGAYIKRGPSGLRIWREVDPASRDTIAFQTEWLRSVNTPIFVDGRGRPPEFAAHTWGGYQVGTWEGERLKVKTTHLKEDYHRRNGVAQSDRATLTEYLMRRRFRERDYLTWVVVSYDPVYLTEPLIRATEYRQDLTNRLQPYPCTVVTEVVRQEDYIPHHFPGENPDLFNFVEYFGLPRDSWDDGAATMYPEYRWTLGDHAKSTARTHTGLPRGVLGGAINTGTPSINTGGGARRE